MTVTYVQVSDVQGNLNASFDGVHTYTVYGLPILDTTIQAACSIANNYINGLIGSDITPSDYRYCAAQTAAIDLACMRVLVIASGGAMVGAYDYFLGDLRVSRAGPYAQALARTIAALQADLLMQLPNLSTPIVTGDVQYAQQLPTDSGAVMSP